ncbi:hypothetical protein CJ010_06905 [Azoarcus sp. DD4]|uniref:hypothetical protein n=1 Tax=Azoarcus sp. DD4 TaxID=2027405 RepID=UPI0011280151|nr:hypothetical protein [Azoarcus sp. DD4]QDF96284.1 hypothetical protein CJ010_06905 [Azoarcus sp. DD4]
MSVETLLLKLLLVPLFLLLVSLAGKRWGPGIAGWLAGLPLVVGPILYFVALEQGPQFAAQAATAAVAAVVASIAFGVAYSHCSRIARWPMALLAATTAWLAVSVLLAAVPLSLWSSFAAAFAVLMVAPYCFPPTTSSASAPATGYIELALRMAAGAALTFGVTLAAGAVGPRWSGLLAVFPVLGTVLAVFSHQQQGGDAATQLLHGMARGFFSFLGFCLAVAIALHHLSVPAAFALAIGVSLAIQLLTRKPPAAARG